jgi:hypothetical protein
MLERTNPGEYAFLEAVVRLGFNLDHYIADAQDLMDSYDAFDPLQRWRRSSSEPKCSAKVGPEHDMRFPDEAIR